MTSELSALSGEVANLRYQVTRERWLFRILGLLAFVALATSRGSTQGTPQELVCKSLRIVNKDGRDVAFLGAGGFGEGSLVLSDSKAEPRVHVGATTRWGFLQLSGPDDRLLVSLAADDGGGYAYVYNTNSKMAGIVLSNETSGGKLRVNGSDGTGRADLYVDEFGSGTIQARNRFGAPRVRAAVVDDAGYLDVSSFNGEAAITLHAPRPNAVSPRMGGLVTVWSRSSVPSVQIGGSRGRGGEIDFYDAAGVRKVQLP